MENDPNTPPNALPPVSTLIQLLTNTVILYQTVPYLPISSLFALGATSKSFTNLIHSTPSVFRHLDLSEVKTAQSSIGHVDHGGEVWRNVQMDENVTEDDFYGAPLRGIFQNLRARNLLQSVQTLILDGLPCPVDLVTEIITQESFHVRILSIRDVKHLSQRKLQQAIMYAIRPSRPEGSPKLQGLYIFGPKGTRQKQINVSTAIAPCCLGRTSMDGTQTTVEDNSTGDSTKDDHRWYGHSGKIYARSPARELEWAEVIQACQGIISFDAVVCSGPRHSPTMGQAGTWYDEPEFYIPPRVATHTLDGCSGCGRGGPEGFARVNHASPSRFPLMDPVPLYSSTVKCAKIPASAGTLSEKKQLLARCMDCLRSRYCNSCHKWWCEDCYEVNPGPNLAKQWEISEAVHGADVVKVHMGLCVEECLIEEIQRNVGFV